MYKIEPNLIAAIILLTTQLPGIAGDLCEKIANTYNPYEIAEITGIVYDGDNERYIISLGNRVEVIDF